MTARTAPRASSQRRSPWSRRYLLQAAALAAPIAVFVVGTWAYRFTAEDAYIYHRVVSNVVAGNGPVFNAGERVEIATSPAWVLILSSVRAVVGDRVGPGVQGAIAGAALATAGLLAAMAGAWRLQRLLRPGEALALPLGVWVVATPVFWAWATGGLETGLALGWLGVAFLALVQRCEQVTSPDAKRSRWPLIVIGLGWLVRPELVIYSVAFFIAAILIEPVHIRGLLRDAAWTWSVPIGAQLLRMGYYATLIPNPGLAKSAGRESWSAGWAFADATLQEASLWAPVVLSLLATAVVAATADSGRRRALVVMAAPIAASLVVLVYVIRIGGEPLPGRLLLPPVLGLCLPAAVVRIPLPLRSTTATAAVVTAVAVTIWAALQLPSIARANENLLPYLAGENPARLFSNPLELTDLSLANAPTVISAHGQGRDVALDFPFLGGSVQEQALPTGWGVVASMCCVGSEVAGVPLDVWVVDQSSLGDPIGSRLERSGTVDIGVNGKLLPRAWWAGRLLPPRPDEPVDEVAARQALGCGDLLELDKAVREPMTVGRFLQNVVAAPRLTFLTINPDPAAASDCAAS